MTIYISELAKDLYDWSHNGVGHDHWTTLDEETRQGWVNAAINATTAVLNATDIVDDSGASSDV